MEGTLNILVTGGSQGSKIIGEVVPLAIAQQLPPPLMARIKVVQQVREEQIDAVRAIYDKAQIESELAPFFANMPERLAETHLVIARSGAGTVSELAAVGRPSILVPLAIAMDDHQAANAEALTEVGAADMLLETNATPKLLGALIAARLSDPDALKARAVAAKSAAKPDAAADLADLAERIAEL
jgi:UDP-N-acetylglucosamine--N-acetylmuramyl-(pentapeptide) pyrophosphoryl-undecaprenol N-acetylglucosamine transferase